MRHWYWIGLILLLVASLAFDQAEDQERHPTVKKEIEKRLKRFRTMKMNQCKIQAVQAAKLKVDSFFIAHEGGDSPALYPVPSRPDRPEWIHPVDTSSVEPIFDNEADSSRLSTD